MGADSSCCKLPAAEENTHETILQRSAHQPEVKIRVDAKFSKDQTHSHQTTDGITRVSYLTIPKEWEVPIPVVEIRDKYGPFAFNHPLTDNLVTMETDHGVYYGTVSNDMPDGVGMLLKQGGELVEGYFSEGKPDKKANVYFPDGSFFSGEWKMGRIEGHGEFLHEGGRGKYVGSWKEDLQWGEGEEVVQDEYHYKGGFLAGERHGQGILILADSSTYTGDFAQGKFHGTGKYSWSDGKHYSGDWKNGTIDGKGEFIWPDGKKYIGLYRNEKKHGFGILHWANGARYEGMWDNGRQHGKGKLILPSGEAYDTNWENGQMLKDDSEV